MNTHLTYYLAEWSLSESAAVSANLHQQPVHRAYENQPAVLKLLTPSGASDGNHLSSQNTSQLSNAGDSLHFIVNRQQAFLK